MQLSLENMGSAIWAWSAEMKSFTRLEPVCSALLVVVTELIIYLKVVFRAIEQLECILLHLC